MDELTAALECLEIDRQSTTTQRALQIPEIILAILLHLPMRDLLLSQRVNQTFHALIRSSKPLQQKLFFAPSQEDQTEGPSELNPLLVQVFPLFLHPRDDMSFYPHDLYSYECTADELDVYLRKEASWREMYTHAPPVKTLTIQRSTGALFLPPSKVDVKDIAGVRMGLLYDLVNATDVWTWITARVGSGHLFGPGGLWFLTGRPCPPLVEFVVSQESMTDVAPGPAYQSKGYIPVDYMPVDFE